jgi:acetolactate decarboxylase
LLFVAAAGCSINVPFLEYADNAITGRETLVQIYTVDALLAGVYDGVVTLEALKRYGDFGIGTFNYVTKMTFCVHPTSKVRRYVL